MEHNCIIGVFNDYEDSELVSVNELKEKRSCYSMKEYTDWRYSTNLTRFVYCPFCGEKIIWKDIKK